MTNISKFYINYSHVNKCILLNILLLFILFIYFNDLINRTDNITVRVRVCVRAFADDCVCLRSASARKCWCLRPVACGFVRIRDFASARACTRGTCAFLRGCAIMPGYPRLGKYKIVDYNSGANKDEGKLFSVYKLRIQAFLLVPKPPL